MPTTVLAQDDSAVGVKNGVNAFGKKNFVGTFAPPHAVLNGRNMLVTLSDRDWRAGISEAIKVALLKDPAFFAWIEAHATDLRERSLGAMASSCTAAPPTICSTSPRAATRSSSAPRGRSTSGTGPRTSSSSSGLRAAPWRGRRRRHRPGFSTYSHLARGLPLADWRRIVDLFAAVGLPAWHRELVTEGADGRPAVLDGLQEFREHLGGRLTIMLLERIGSGFEVHEMDEAVVLEASALLRRRFEGEDARWQRTPALAR